MSAALSFDNLANYLKDKDNAELNEMQYKELLGKTMPKGKSYLKNQSSLAKWLAANGYAITKVHEKAVIERTICIRKHRT